MELETKITRENILNKKYEKQNFLMQQENLRYRQHHASQRPADRPDSDRPGRGAEGPPVERDEEG